MKAGSKRRRSRAEIVRDKLLNAQKEREVQEKLAQFNYMQQRIKQLELFEGDRQNLSDAFQHLKSKGLIKQEFNGNFSAVNSYEEAEKIRKQVEEDQKIASQMQNDMQAQPGFTPDPERQKSSLMLEEGEAVYNQQIQPKFGNETTLKSSSNAPQN